MTEIILLTDDEGHYVGVAVVNGEDCCVEWCSYPEHTMLKGKTKELFDEKWYWRYDPHHVLRGEKMQLLDKEIEGFERNKDLLWFVLPS